MSLFIEWDRYGKHNSLGKKDPAGSGLGGTKLPDEKNKSAEAERRGIRTGQVVGEAPAATPADKERTTRPAELIRRVMGTLALRL